MFRKGINVFALRFISVFFSFAQLSLVAKVTDVGSFGRFLLALSIAIYVGLFLVFGLNQRCLKCINEFIVAGELLKAKYFAGFLLIIASLFAAAVLLIVLLGELIVSQYRSIDELSVILIYLSGFLYAIQLISCEVFRSRGRFSDFLLYGGIFATMLFTAIVSFIFAFDFKVSINQLLIVYLFSQLIQCVVSQIAMRTLILYPSISEMGDFLTEFKFGFPVMLNSLFQYGIGPGVIAVAGLVMSGEEIAIFGVATRLGGLMLFVSTLIYATFPNKIIELNIKRHYRRMEIVVKFASVVGAIATLPLLFVFLLFGTWMLKILYGNFLTAAYFPLVIVAFGNFVNVWTGMRGAILQLTGRNFQQLYITMTGGLLMVALVLFMGQMWGAVGASLAFAIAVSCQCGIEMFYVRRYLKIGTIGFCFGLKRFFVFRRILNVG